MAHKKGASSSRNGRDSNAQRLGVKRFGGQFVNAGEDSHDLKLQRLDPASGVQVGPVLGAGPVQPGDYENIDTLLKKGTKYVLWCSLADHRLRGMEATIKVARHRTSPS